MNALLDFLKATGMSQSQLAERLGVHETQVSHWITGRRAPSAENLKHIWKVTGISPEKLLADIEARSH